MKNLMAIILAATSTFALEAPYLIGATAAGDTGVELSWRNNNASSTGYRVLRKDTTALDYKLIDSVKSATQLSFLDNAGLKPSKLYTYQVQAYDASAVSDTSNSIQVTMPAAPGFIDTFVAPGISVTHSYPITVTIYDYSNSEKGYRIYRAPVTSSSFTLIAQIVSVNPAHKDTITIHDTAAAPNTWYNYMAVVYNAADTISSPITTVYTFQFSGPRTLARFTKLSNFPISDSGGWSALAGDSVILKESNAPTGKFTAINVANPSAPQFAGYLDSATLLSYPLKTLIPVYLHFGLVNSYMNSEGFPSYNVFCSKNAYAIVATTNGIQSYAVINNSFTLIGSVQPSIEELSVVMALNDSFFCALNSQYPTYLYPVRVSAAGVLLMDSSLEVGSFSYGAGYAIGLDPYIRGLCSNTLLVGENWYGSSGSSRLSNQYMVAYDLSLSQQFASSSVSAAWLNYSGILLSNNQFLSFDTAHIYAEDPRDLNAYQTALANDAVLTDSFSSRQNVLVDTVNKRLYILYKTNMSIFSYAFSPVGVINRAGKPLQLPGELRILSSAGQSGITIVFPGAARHADLAFYDLSGRIVDRLTATGSNAVLWRPKTHASGCYVVSAKIDGETYSARFMVR